MLNDRAVSMLAGGREATRYADLLANVRYDGLYHSVTSLVKPSDPEVKETARVLLQADDFVRACQDLINSYTKYKDEVGDYWAEPAETIKARAGDCDDLSILLCSLLRNYIPADNVYCAFGLWSYRGKRDGHMWVIMGTSSGEDRIIEATAPSSKTILGKYVVHGFFNDQYAFATDIGLREFDLIPVELKTPLSGR